MATAGEIHRQYFDTVVSRDWNGLRGLLHADYTYTGPDGKEAAGADAAIASVQPYLEAFPDIKLNIKKVYAEGNISVVEFAPAGTHTGELMGIAPTNKKISMVGCNVIEVKDGKVYREREYYDVMSLMEQLGVAPAAV